jgi:hypothetical protein
MLVCGLVVLGLLLGAGPALAGGGGGSAGNSQYVDPLSGQPHPSHHKTRSSSTSAASSTSTTSTSPSSTLSQAAPSSVSSSTTSSQSPSNASSSSSGKTLPFTGLNLWACIGLGLGLLGAGLALRRALARTY